MKPQFLTPIVLVLCIILAVLSCNKNSNNYSTTDHTIGMVKVREWKGNAYGNANGDTMEGLNHFGWPRAYNRVIDTNFSVLAINGFLIEALGTRFPFRSVDSVTKITKFDTTYTGSAISYLNWNFGTDVMTLEIHIIHGHNDTAMAYYETNWVLHSP